MKRFFAFGITVVIAAVLAVGVMHATGVVRVQDLLTFLMDGDQRQIAWEDTTQAVRDGATQLYSRLADHKPPSGSGRPLEGDLPEDRIPDAGTLYEFPREFYPYRAMLDANEQAAYDQVYAYAAELYEKLPLHTPISTDSVARVMSAVYYDHPELFWIETAYQYNYTGDGKVVAVTLLYNDTASAIRDHRDRFDAAVAEVVREASRFDHPADQEKYVHDWLLDNVSYQLDAPLNQSAYSAVIYGETVCAGYARAFQLMLRELGIPAYYCAGFAGEAHAWNIVKLEDGYYHVDVAWDDPLGNTSGQRYYNYFNITDAQIAPDHTRTELSLNLPACNADAFSYQNYFAGEEELPSGATAPGAPSSRTPEDLGYRREDAVSSLEAYYDHCRERLVALGEGTHTFTLLVEGEALTQRIFTLTENREALERYAEPAAQELGMRGYSASVSLQGEELADGYWLVTQQVRFQSAGGAARTEEPQPPPDPGPEPDASRQESEPEEYAPEEPDPALLPEAADESAASAPSGPEPAPPE